LDLVARPDRWGRWPLKEINEALNSPCLSCCEERILCDGAGPGYETTQFPKLHREKDHADEQIVTKS